jgi:hypothetical protein
LDQCLPGEEVVFIHRPGGDAVWRGDEEGLVFREEAFGGHAGSHVVESCLVGKESVRQVEGKVLEQIFSRNFAI